MEFKGTDKDFELRGNKIFVKGSFKTIATIHVQKNYEEITFKPIEDVEANANAKLLLNSLKMLKFLTKVNNKKTFNQNDFDEIKEILKEVIQ